jgi:acyl-CoA oxidase
VHSAVLHYVALHHELPLRVPHSAPDVQALAALYGLTRVERAAPFLLASGVLTGADMAELRTQINELCAALAANSAHAALQLCDGFGIPEHLLWAPIASDWRKIGAE